MAKPLTPEQITLLQSEIEYLTPIQIYTLAMDKLLEPNDARDGLKISKKATNALKRAARGAQLETVKEKVFEALKVLGTSTEKKFRLDDVLKVTELPKSEYRNLIMQSLRFFDQETVFIEKGDGDGPGNEPGNNFQIYYWPTSDLVDISVQPAATETEESSEDSDS